MNAFVLFSGSREGMQGKDASKALHPLEGRPIFLYILKALDQVRSIDQIVVIGPQKMIMDAIERSLPDALFEKRIVVLNKKARLFENIQNMYEGSPSVRKETTDLCVLPQIVPPPALFLPAEIPLVTTQEIEAFISGSDLSEYDTCLGVTREETLGLFHPEGEKPGFGLKGFSVKGEAYRMTHLHLVRPDHLNGVATIQKIYEGRHVPIPGNRTCLLSEIIDLFASETTAPAKAAQAKTRFNLIETIPCGGAVKVDDDESYRIMSLRFNEWRSALTQKKDDEGDTPICPLSGHICKDALSQEAFESE